MPSACHSWYRKPSNLSEERSAVKKTEEKKRTNVSLRLRVTGVTQEDFRQLVVVTKNAGDRNSSGVRQLEARDFVPSLGPHAFAVLDQSLKIAKELRIALQTQLDTIKEQKSCMKNHE
jgi:hypothetical protein